MSDLVEIGFGYLKTLLIFICYHKEKWMAIFTDASNSSPNLASFE